MKRRLESPFLSLKRKPVSVFQNPDGSFAWMISTGSVSTKNTPVGIQEKEKIQAKINVMVIDAGIQLGKELGISPAAARKLFFASTTSPKAAAIAALPAKRLATIKAQLEALVADQILEQDDVKAIIEPQAEVVYEFLDYLDKEDKALYFELSAKAQDLPEMVATMMMQQRLAYQLTLSEPAKAKAKQLYVYRPWFAVEVGDCFEFDSFKVMVTEPYDPETGAIGVAAIAAALPAKATGFLLTPDHTTYAMGDESWTQAQTDELSVMNADGSSSQITALYNFYLKEAGKLAEETELNEISEPTDQSLGESVTPLLSSAEPSRSTGENSTGVSNPTDSTMNGSVPLILETVPIG